MITDYLETHPYYNMYARYKMRACVWLPGFFGAEITHGRGRLELQHVLALRAQAQQLQPDQPKERLVLLPPCCAGQLATCRVQCTVGARTVRPTFSSMHD